MVARRTVLGGIATGAGLSMVGGVAPLSAAPPGTQVTGPITGGKRGYPFSAYLGDISEVGYVEEEFFLEGIGTKYQSVGETGIDGKWNVEPIGEAPFKTRLLVRRPIDPAKFNGIVLVEWLNVTAGHDTATIGPITDGLFRDGYAYVGVTVQRAGVEGYASNPQGLKAWDPERYGSLSIPGDSISYDIMTQAGRAVGPNRPVNGVDPLRGLEVERIIATGASQSAGRLRTYANAIQPRARVFDGLMPTIDFGLGFGFNDVVIDPNVGMPSPDRVFLRGRIRDDLNVPVLVVNSETETLLYAPSRQPDSPRFRLYEVAGASHVPARWDRYLKQMRERDGLASEDDALGSEVMWEPTGDVALNHLAAWIREGKQPPKADRIELTMNGQMPEVVRDEHGNALGGIRMPELEVPVASYKAALIALNAAEGLRGVTIPFDEGKVAQLYPTKADYVAKVAAAAKSALDAGFIDEARYAEYLATAETGYVGLP